MTVMVIMIIMVVVMAIYHHITIICDGNGREVHSYDDVNYGGGDSNDGCGGYGDE